MPSVPEKRDPQSALEKCRLPVERVEMTSPIVVTAEFVAAEGRLDNLREALREAIPAVHAEDGCLLYAIHDAPDERIIMIEKWESEDLLDAHGAGPAVARLNKLIDGLIAEPVKVERLWPIAAGTPEQGAL